MTEANQHPHPHQKPIQTFREGAVGASVWLREAQKGPFYEVTFSRSYKNDRTGASGYSQAFPDRLLPTLIRVAERAQAWIDADRRTSLVIADNEVELHAAD